MSYGIEKTQMQEWRSKNKFRLFVEERLVDAKDVSIYTYGLFKKVVIFVKTVGLPTANFWLYAVAVGFLAFVLIY